MVQDVTCPVSSSIFSREQHMSFMKKRRISIRPEISGGIRIFVKALESVHYYLLNISTKKPHYPAEQDKVLQDYYLHNCASLFVEQKLLTTY